MCRLTQQTKPKNTVEFRYKESMKRFFLAFSAIWPGKTIQKQRLACDIPTASQGPVDVLNLMVAVTAKEQHS